MAKTVIKSGSQPYDDGSGFQYDIEVHSGSGDPDYLYIGNDRALCVRLDEWERLKRDVVQAITAFKMVAAPEGGE